MMLKQFSTWIHLYYLQLKKYQFRYLIWPLVIIPLTFILDIVLRNAYIEEVLFYGKYVPYLYILFLASVVVDLFGWIVPQIFYNIIPYDKERIYQLLMMDTKQWIAAVSIWNLLLIVLRTTIIFLPFKLLYNLSISYYFITLLAICAIIPFSVGLGLLLSYFAFTLRHDAEPLWWSISTVAWSVFPLGYALTIFSEKTRYIIEIIVPIFGIIEEFRKLAILGQPLYNVLLQSIFVSIIYLLAGYIIFKYSYNKARKTGKILLS